MSGPLKSCIIVCLPSRLLLIGGGAASCTHIEISLPLKRGFTSIRPKLRFLSLRRRPSVLAMYCTFFFSQDTRVPLRYPPGMEGGSCRSCSQQEARMKKLNLFVSKISTLRLLCRCVTIIIHVLLVNFLLFWWGIDQSVLSWSTGNKVHFKAHTQQLPEDITWCI